MFDYQKKSFKKLTFSGQILKLHMVNDSALLLKKIKDNFDSLEIEEGNQTECKDI